MSYINNPGSGISPPIPPSNSDTIQVVNFTFQSGTMVLQSVTAGQIINRSVVIVSVPFDDPLASVQLGTTALPGLILGGDDVTASVADQYGNDAIVDFTAPEILILTISPGASTQGSGMLFYRVK